MPVELRLSSRLTLTGVIVAFLLSASSAFAGASEDCTAAAAYGQQDYVAALRLCRPLAEQGDAKAQSDLGFMYAKGQGVPQDDAEAVRWYRKAAEQGTPARRPTSAGCTTTAKACRRTTPRPLNWYPQGRRPGERRRAGQPRLRCTTTAKAWRKDDAQAVTWYRKAAEQGDADAQCNLGWMYRTAEA